MKHQLSQLIKKYETRVAQLKLVSEDEPEIAIELNGTCIMLNSFIDELKILEKSFNKYDDDMQMAILHGHN